MGVCRFEHNQADVGGAVYLENGVSIDQPDGGNIIFDSNTATYYGGAIAWAQKHEQPVALDFTSLEFTHNEAFWGGAVYGAGGLLTITAADPNNNPCSFQNNKAAIGGAVMASGYLFGGVVYSAAAMFITGASFTNNVASIHTEYSYLTALGGAIFADPDTLLNIQQATFTANTADYGGAILSIGQKVDLTTCKFVSNTATISGGAVHFGTYPTNPLVIAGTPEFACAGCTFSGNTAVQGGALAVHIAHITLSAATYFVGNTATKSGGGAIYIQDSEVRKQAPLCRLVGCTR